MGTRACPAPCSGTGRHCSHRAYSSVHFGTFFGTKDSIGARGTRALDAAARVGRRRLRGMVREAWSRREFLKNAGSAVFLAGVCTRALRGLAATATVATKITDIQTMTLTGPRTYVLVKVSADNGHYGIAEAYGLPSIGVKEQIQALKPLMVGKNPLEIDAIYTFMGMGGPELSGTRTDGSAHSLMRAASGIEMALWDLAGKTLGQPATTLLGGKFRDKVRVYDHEAPRNMLDKASCREWAQKVKEDPRGFTAHKFGFPHTRQTADRARDLGNKALTTKELIQIRQGFENCREAVGWDHDIMVHCHWEYNLPAAIQLAEAVESIKP